MAPIPCLFARGLFENLWNFRNLGIVFCCEAEGANKIEKLTWDRDISPVCQRLREQGGGVRDAEGRESSPLCWLLPVPGSGEAIDRAWPLLQTDLGDSKLLWDKNLILPEL